MGDDLHLSRRMAGPQKSSSNMANFSGWTCARPTKGKIWARIAWKITVTYGKIKGLDRYHHLYIWVNYNDLTATSLEIMVGKGNYHHMTLIHASEIF